jgi:hypothetical protein
METEIKRKYLYGHTSPETAYVVDDYPWGFRLRTTIRYWIESKKNQGQRFVSQTINPKNGLWCAPKRGTYSPIIILYLDEKDHVACTCLSMNHEKEKIEEFKETHADFFDEFQKDQFCQVRAFCSVMDKVTWTINPSPVGPVSLLSNDPIDVAKRKQLIHEQEEREIETNKQLNKINHAICGEYLKNKKEI